MLPILHSTGILYILLFSYQLLVIGKQLPAFCGWHSGNRKIDGSIIVWNLINLIKVKKI